MRTILDWVLAIVLAPLQVRAIADELHTIHGKINVLDDRTKETELLVAQLWAERKAQG